MDYRLYRLVNGLSGNSFVDGVFKFLAGALPTMLVVAVALLFLVRWRTTARSAAQERCSRRFRRRWRC